MSFSAAELVALNEGKLKSTISLISPRAYPFYLFITKAKHILKAHLPSIAIY